MPTEDREPKSLAGVSDAELRAHTVPPPFRPLRPRKKLYPQSPPLHVPGIAEHFTRRPHRFKCPRCFRVFHGIYKPEKPLPVCMGGNGREMHPRFMLVSEVYDEYQNMVARFRRGDPTTRPLITPHNGSRFERQAPGESVRDLGILDASPRG